MKKYFLCWEGPDGISRVNSFEDIDSLKAYIKEYVTLNTCRIFMGEEIQYHFDLLIDKRENKK
jgi:hypothetical protein